MLNHINCYIYTCKNSNLGYYVIKMIPNQTERVHATHFFMSSFQVHARLLDREGSVLGTKVLLNNVFSQLEGKVANIDNTFRHWRFHV